MKYSSESYQRSFNVKRLFYHIWPIHRSELPKFLLTTALMFCILLIQNLIRATKDSIVNTMIATQATSFLKLWGVLPAAFLMTIIYIKLVSTIRSQKIFYIILSSFLLFFFAFGFIIFPNHQSLHVSDQTLAELTNYAPNFKWLILIVGKWSFSLFYIIAELWPNAIFSLLFWQFVNMVTTVEQSKRFYILFSLFGQTGLYISGQILMHLNSTAKHCIVNYNLQCDHNIFSIQILTTIILVLGCSALFIFWVLNNYVIVTENINFKAKSSKVSIVDGIRLAFELRYIRLILTLLICYGMAINLVEHPWKNIASTAYPTLAEYNAFVGSYLSYTGIVTIIFVLIGSNIVRYLGWFAAAIITPVIMFFTGTALFVSAGEDSLRSMFGILYISCDPVNTAITVGIVQNVISKSTKYTLFDSTKEMSYVPLDSELKNKGKATADMLGVKLGKSLSSFLFSVIFILVPNTTYQSITGYLMVLFIVICLIWIWAVKELNKEYMKIAK